MQLKMVLFLCGCMTLLISGRPSQAQLSPEQIQPLKPLGMPMAIEPGPGTWLFGQAYGNTTGAFNFGDRWYRAGQGLHFGIDFGMPCGTPLVAVADGTVAYVDDMGFGSAPHNLVLRHDALELTTLYGHLLQTPTLEPGEFVQQGQVVGLSGDPDETCSGRPHLHLEVRSMDYSRAYNPIDLIEANWHSLALIGPYSLPLFQQNLQNPRQWITLEQQPNVQFWGQVLNRYTNTYPVASGGQSAPSVSLERRISTMPSETDYTLRQVTTDRCCANAMWNPADANTLYVVDGGVGTGSSAFELNLLTEARRPVRPAPLPVFSPDGAYEIEPFVNGFSKVRRRADGLEYSVDTSGSLPTLNPSNTSLLWTVSADEIIPGQARPQVDVYLSDIDGENVRAIFQQAGTGAMWLSDERVLLSTRNEQRETTLYVYMLDADRAVEIGTWRELRGLSVAPGGERLSFYLTWQDDPTANGVYVVDIAQPMNTTVQQMSWFGAWRWRDADSLYYVPYRPDEAHHTVRVAHLLTGADVPLAADAPPFTIADGHWRVSADGRRILFQNADDNGNLYVLEPSR